MKSPNIVLKILSVLIELGKSKAVYIEKCQHGLGRGQVKPPMKVGMAYMCLLHGFWTGLVLGTQKFNNIYSIFLALWKLRVLEPFDAINPPEKSFVSFGNFHF